jgi:hypothetical protein
MQKQTDLGAQPMKMLYHIHNSTQLKACSFSCRDGARSCESKTIHSSSVVSSKRGMVTSSQSSTSKSSSRSEELLAPQSHQQEPRISLRP